MELLQKAFSLLYTAGLRHTEGVALFVGIHEGDSFRVTDVYEPKYIASCIEEGLYYAIDAEEIYKLNKWLHSEKKKLIAQIHSHPGAAYHSEADDEYAIVSTMGGLSIVVPDFATGEISLCACAVYRLNADNTWQWMESEEIETLITMV